MKFFYVLLFSPRSLFLSRSMPQPRQASEVDFTNSSRSGGCGVKASLRAHLSDATNDAVRHSGAAALRGRGNCHSLRRGLSELHGLIQELYLWRHSNAQKNKHTMRKKQISSNICIFSGDSIDLDSVVPRFRRLVNGNRCNIWQIC